LNIPKFKITTNGDLMVYTQHNSGDNNYNNNYYSMEELVEFQQQRIEALQSHIEFLEGECKALYSQLDDCDCDLIVTD